MPSLTLFGDAQWGTSGTYTIPMATYDLEPTFSDRHYVDVDGLAVYYWTIVNRVTGTVMQGGAAAFNIPAGRYHLKSADSIYSIFVELRTTGQYQFGPLYIGNSVIGGGGAGGGSDVNDRFFGVFERVTSSYGTGIGLMFGDTSEGLAGYYAPYVVAFDGIEDAIITPDTPPTPPDPYAPPSGQAGNDSAAGGGGSGGAGYPTGTNAGVPDSKKNRANVGVDIYVCNSPAVKAFTKMLWGSTNTGFIDAFFKRVQNTVYNPIDAIITCHSLPSAFAPTGGTATGIKAGGVDFSTYDAACVGAPVTSEWVQSSLFTYSPLEECWGTYADYANTSVSIYLPFCGVVPLEPSAIFAPSGSGGGGVAVQYWCNILNGNCAAFVLGWARDGDYKVLKIATGNCAQPCPISGNDRGMQQKLGAAIGFAQGMLSMGSQYTHGSMPNNFDLAKTYLQAGSQFLTAAQHTEVVGSLNGAAGFAASTEIILMFDFPIPVESENFTMIRGRPSEVSGSISAFSGYCELEVHADYISGATDFEKREIERLCAQGVIV